MNMLRTAAALLAVVFVSRVCVAQDNLTVIMSGLDNPRGLALGPDGGIYVAEAGRGGNGAVVTGPEGPRQFGASGAVSRYLNGAQQRVITGLPSLATQTGPTPGGPAAGVSALAFNSAGELYGVIGLGGVPATRDALGAAGSSMGQLVRLPLGGVPQNVADLLTYEATVNPDGGGINANPFGLVSLPGGAFAVTDAGGNSLLNISSAGAISTRSVFPQRPNPLPTGPPMFDSVPTRLAVGPDGALYVGELTGVPYPPGAANIYRIDPATGTPAVVFDGFTNVIDLAFGTDGDLYVLQISTNGLASAQGPGPGKLIHIDSGTGVRTTLLSDPLFFPSGLLLTPDGRIYVSNRGTSPGGGQVLLVPEPGMGAALAIGCGALALRWRRRR